MQTQIGLIAEMIQSFETEPTPLQSKLDKLGRTLGIAALIVCGLVFLIGIVRYLLNPTPGVTLVEAILEFFIVAVSLAIAAVPEGLPAVVTICLALGMQRMIARTCVAAPPARGRGAGLGNRHLLGQDRHADTERHDRHPGLGRRHAALRQRRGLFSGRRVSLMMLRKWMPRRCRRSICCCGRRSCATTPISRQTEGQKRRHDGWRMVGDPTEGALVVAAAKAGYWRDEVERDLPRVAEIPFDSERKRMTTIHELRRLALREKRSRA